MDGYGMNTIDIDEVTHQELDACDSFEYTNSYSSYTESSEFFTSLVSEEEPNMDLTTSDRCKRRGRKPIRPNDPIRKKTEEKDKYWLRAFRAYMKAHIAELKKLLLPAELKWWKFYLSADGKPGKGHSYLSYGKMYKNYIFSQPTFVKFFRSWFTEFGDQELRRKCAPGTDLWFVFYDYAQNELYNYNGPDGPTGEGIKLPGKVEERVQHAPDDYDMEVDSFLNECSMDCLP
mmetsp:Transcript_18497/g.33371  ORF Transcript_18497/g.33371 Transcript_18497/m.33371 type:complete len:232 (-) Transcript_18497:36-731(-)